jgi:two-component SAPR family response regulator
MLYCRHLMVLCTCKHPLKMIVLVIDSSVHIIERLQHILSETANIKAAYGAVSYKDAARFFKTNKIDVVLLDGGLPGNMSVDLLNEIKTFDEKISVIILANSTDNYVKAKYQLHGADFFFDKYHEFESIPGIIDTLTKKKHQACNEITERYTEFV